MRRLSGQALASAVWLGGLVLFIVAVLLLANACASPRGRTTQRLIDQCIMTGGEWSQSGCVWVDDFELGSPV